jgi:DNA-binding beta-propeller fold protein YncE
MHVKPFAAALALALALAPSAVADVHETCLFPPDLLPPDEAAVATPMMAGGEAPYRIAIRFLIVRRSDGSGGLDESLLHYFMRDLNYGFRDTPFDFVQLPEITYIDNDAHYANIPNWPTARALLSSHHVPGVMNHIITPTIFGGPPVTGLNFVSNPRGNIVAYERIGHPHSIVFPPHEVGHVLFLYHPFETQFGAECTSGEGCEHDGDLVCDTPASPAVHGGNTTATGRFFADIPGPCEDDPPFAPLTDLYMEAGWPAGHILRDRFTDEQIARMENTLHTISPDLIVVRPEILVDCNGNGTDDVEEINAGAVPDVNRDLVPDSCQTFPRPGDLLVSGMTNDVLNRVRFFDRDTGDFRETMWNGLTWVHQLREGPDGLIYIARLSFVTRLDLETGRSQDNFLDTVEQGGTTLGDLLFTDDGEILVLDIVGANIRRYSAEDGSFLGVFANIAATGMSSPKYGGLIAGQGLVFHDGLLYVSNGGSNNVLRYDPSDGTFAGTFVTTGAGGLSNPHSLRFGPDGHLYVASRDDDTVKRYDGTTGAPLGDFVAAGADGLDQPAGLYFVPIRTGDVDRDGTVGVGDLLVLLAEWGPCGDPCPGTPCPADIDGDCTVGAGDLVTLLAEWG